MKHDPDDLFEEVKITPYTDPKTDEDPNSKQDLNPDPKLHGDENDDDTVIKVNENDRVIEGDKASSTTDCNIHKSKKSVTWSHALLSESPSPTTSYSALASIPPINFSSDEFRSKMDSVKGALGRWSKRVGEATRKAEDLAGNTWQHLKTGPSFAEAALGRIAQGTKVLAEGGYEKIFQQTFETVPEEKLQDAFACYLSTSVGPVMGVLYVSTEKLAYCSDNPLSYQDNGTTEWSYYKVTIPLYQLKAVKPSSGSSNSSEKYIQVISVDNHEFWFMGFLNYSVAENLLTEVLEVRSLQSA